jgi:malate dehydrogenase (oxaloacetate-decarboxylating)(NADP+)
MPFDPRLLIKIAPAVAKAAEDSGVATRPIKDMQAYADSLQQFVYRSGTFMKPLFLMAKPRRPTEAHRLRRRRRRARAARRAGGGR